MSQRGNVTKVVSSRFKQAAARVASQSSNNDSSSSSSGTKLTRSNSVRERKPFSSAAIARKKQLSKTLNLSGKNGSKSSVSSVSQANDGSSASDNHANNTSKTRKDLELVQKKETSVCRETGNTVSPNLVSYKMHSTAVNATMLNISSMPSGSGSPSFPEMPDISVIKRDPCDFITPPLPVTEECSHQPSGCTVSDDRDVTDDDLSEVTQESLDLAYLNYLTWCNLRVSAEAAHCAAIQPVMRELSFLESLLSSKQGEVSELRQKISLLSALKEVRATYECLTPELSVLSNGSSEWCTDLKELSAQLECHLHQITLSPAVLPDSPEAIVAPLKDLVSVCSEILRKVENCYGHQQIATAVLDDSTKLEKCCRTMHEAACSALMKCSLQLTSSANNTCTLLQ